MFMHLSCIRILSFPFLFSVVKVLFCLSLSISLSLSDRLCMVPKRKSTSSWNPLYSKTSSSDPTPLHVRFRDEKAQKETRRTSPQVVFIRNAAWFYRTFLILLYPLSFTVRDGNLCVRYLWVVPLWSFRSSTPICIVSIPLYLNLLRAFEVHVL